MLQIYVLCIGFPGDSLVNYPPANTEDTGDAGSTPGSGRSLGGGNINPLQSSCLGNPMGKKSLVGYSPYGHKESDMTY